MKKPLELRQVAVKLERPHRGPNVWSIRLGDQEFYSVEALIAAIGKLPRDEIVLFRPDCELSVVSR